METHFRSSLLWKRKHQVARWLFSNAGDNLLGHFFLKNPAVGQTIGRVDSAELAPYCHSDLSPLVDPLFGLAGALCGTKRGIMWPETPDWPV